MNSYEVDKAITAIYEMLTRVERRLATLEGVVRYEATGFKKEKREQYECVKAAQEYKDVYSRFKEHYKAKKPRTLGELIYGK